MQTFIIFSHLLSYMGTIFERMYEIRSPDENGTQLHNGGARDARLEIGSPSKNVPNTVGYMIWWYATRLLERYTCIRRRWFNTEFNVR